MGRCTDPAFRQKNSIDKMPVPQRRKMPSNGNAKKLKKKRPEKERGRARMKVDPGTE